jgi:hypothetical protein
MSKFKGTGIFYVKSLVRSSSSEQQNVFLSMLNPDERKAYETVLAISWISIDAAAKILKAAAEVLYPGDPAGLRAIGYKMAHNDLSGIYKILMPVLSVAMAMSQTGKLWSQYHDEGRAWTDKINEKTYIFNVADYPSLPEHFREMLAGYVKGVVERTGEKVEQVQRNDINPKQWKWTITITLK